MSYDEIGTLSGESSATVTILVDRAHVTLAVDGSEIADAYLIEGEMSDAVFDFFAERLKVVMRRRWGIAVKGRA